MVFIGFFEANFPQIEVLSHYYFRINKGNYIFGKPNGCGFKIFLLLFLILFLCGDVFNKAFNNSSIDIDCYIISSLSKIFIYFFPQVITVGGDGVFRHEEVGFLFCY